MRRNRAIGTLNLGRLRGDAFSEEDLYFLGQVANQIAIAVENALEYGQMTRMPADAYSCAALLVRASIPAFDMDYRADPRAPPKPLNEEVLTIAPPGGSCFCICSKSPCNRAADHTFTVPVHEGEGSREQTCSRSFAFPLAAELTSLPMEPQWTYRFTTDFCSCISEMRWSTASITISGRSLDT